MYQYAMKGGWALFVLCALVICNESNAINSTSASSLVATGSDNNAESDLTLQLVQLLFRHGDRNPIDPYPLDPYKNESFWPEGYGQLTKRGKMQHFKLGQFLRKRYDGYISRDYSPYEILVQSSDVDRALMSASANLAGLYPPVDNFSLWNPNLIWQPIPIHSLYSPLDNKLRLNASCPRYESLKKQFRSSDVMNQVNAENEDLYEMLTNHSGRNVHDPTQVDYLYDVLFIESLYHKQISDWGQAVIHDPRVINLTAFSFKMITFTEEMKRLKGGPLVKEMIQHIQDRISGSLDKRRKLFMFSAHDTTVATFLNTLDIFNMIPPPYASLVLVDLLKNETSGQHLVRISFKNTTDQEPYVLTLPGCKELCPIEDFIRITKPIIPDDWDAECKSSEFVQLLGGSILGLILGGILVFLFIFVVPILLIIRYRRSTEEPPKYPYLHLQMDDEEA